MKYNKILSEISFLEEDYKKILNKIENSNLLKSKKNIYLEKDKKEFLNFWKEFEIFIKKLRNLIKKNKYRKFIFFMDYNKLVIRRYLLIFYFNIIVDLVNLFGKHEDFIRTFLRENFYYDFGKIAKFIYKPNYVNLLNTPIIFLGLIREKINKHLNFMLSKEKNNIGKNKRFLTNYKNFYYYFKKRWYKILFYLAKKIGEIIARTKFSTRKKGLISKNNLNKYLEIGKPGDIFLTRGNWNASNITIPGFWKHMSIYLGTGEFLKDNYLRNYNFLNNLENKKHYIIEATGNGVEIKTIQKFVSHNDYLGVSRTKFTKKKILNSVKKAISYYGIPYDYIFNFYSDTNVVCSELVLKSFSKTNENDEGLQLKLEKIKGSLTYPPNNFINEIFKEKNNLEFVFFIDSIEKKLKNFVSDKKEFKKSAKRSRFSFMLK